MAILVDSNVILDLVNQDATWLEWSRSAMEAHTGAGLFANAMVYAELCCNAQSTHEVNELLNGMEVQMAEIPREALFLAAKAHLVYRRRGGTKVTPLPDFFIGAHAEAMGVPILTRDPRRYKTYFPGVPLICP